MARIVLPPYKDISSSGKTTSEYESERHVGLESNYFSSRLDFRSSWASQLVVGDALALFPLRAGEVPFQLDVTSIQTAYTDFYFDLGIAYQGDEVAIDPVFFVSVNASAPLPASLRTPYSLIKRDVNRRVKPIEESLTFADNFERFQSSPTNYDVLLTITGLPASTDFALQFNLIGVSRRFYSPSS